ncbi:putative endo-1,3(4)-beta-glucanase [Talaromyces proteolyticus]|uniref:Endo-1,3(4)-beta-glucanase n=1 Tax=Talaromyces proteolyticus TaxID=1131652 RepID=A0AAD4Q032_9EURO|nr:putative endo-1,3(4)-beta-glucanase [Talaromyces proteolyticus]KAH8696606.1 putative endo-1,3(4)-beta-glucanase [Talaromyces proteolyticus]
MRTNLLYASAALTAVPVVNIANCDCYTVSGPDPGFFQHHRFWDFRQVPLNAAAARTHDFHPAGQAPLMNFDPQSTPVLLKDTPFASEWAVQDWGRGGTPLFPVTIVNSDKNVYLTRHPAGGLTFLAMRTTRFERYSSTAEIESRIQNFMHVSLRVRLRLLSNGEQILSPPRDERSLHRRIHTVSASTSYSSPRLAQSKQKRFMPSGGACVGIFTFFSRTSESDIEILTSEPPTRAHYANQPDYDPVRNLIIPGSQVAVDAPIPWTTWSTYRLDWLPSMSRWYVENQQQASMTYGIPVDPSRLLINLWSDGGLWSGNLTIGDSVHLGIEWIEVAYNQTGDVPRPCNVKCRIDGVANPGVPEVM